MFLSITEGQDVSNVRDIAPMQERSPTFNCLCVYLKLSFYILTLFYLSSMDNKSDSTVPVTL